MNEEALADFEEDTTPMDWLNTGGPHNHTGANAQCVKRGGILRQVSRNEIRNFLDKFQPLSRQGSAVRTRGKRVEVKEAFELKAYPGGWFDVINTETGKALNDKRMRETAARQLLNNSDVKEEADA